MDVCLSSELVSPTCVSLNISINMVDYITNATVLIQKQRPAKRRDRLAHNGGKVSDSAVSQLLWLSIWHIFHTSAIISKHVVKDFASGSRIAILSIILQ